MINCRNWPHFCVRSRGWTRHHERVGSPVAVEFKFLAWSSIAQSVCQRAFSLLAIWCMGPRVQILHSAEEHNLSPFDLNIACMCQSIEINNNKQPVGCAPATHGFSMMTSGQPGLPVGREGNFQTTHDYIVVEWIIYMNHVRERSRGRPPVSLAVIDGLALWQR